MAIAIKKGKYIHIQWYDPILGKTQLKTTKLKYNAANLAKAEKFAKRLQDELRKKNYSLR